VAFVPLLIHSLGYKGAIMTKITRRSALISSLALVGTGTASCAKPIDYDVEYAHGVASGDPQMDKIILWTRITTVHTGRVDGNWQMSETSDFSKLARKGKFTTDAARDYTVKVDANKLKPGRIYFYRFIIGDMVSPIGKTKTLPSGSVEDARFAVVSCSNYPFGFFNVYDDIAKQAHFDAVIHLGDYFYEYGRDGYGGKVGAKLGREHEPAHEIISLADYRTRHAQYKGDPQTQAVHAAHPFICVWDDHETANDSWKSGAQNHNEGEGSWDARRAAAMQAYYEWMPVRNPAQGTAREALFRTYSFGNLLTITSIETRLTARSQQLDYTNHLEAFKTPEGIGNFLKNILGDPARELLGPVQMDYIKTALKTSKDKGQPWRLIANQVIMARQHSPDITDYAERDFIKEIEKVFPKIHEYIAFSPLGLPSNLDAWDGYPAARERFYDMARAQGASDLLVLTGDTHVSWANKLVDSNEKAMGVELGVTGTTSPGYNAYFKDATEDYSSRIRAKNPDIIWTQSAENGYIDLQLNHAQGRADFVSVNTVYAPEYKTFVSKSFKIEKSDDSLTLKDI